MIPSVVNIKQAGKSTEQLIGEIVEAVNTLAQNMQLALQNVDMSDVVSEYGVSLETLLQQGALKGETGADGAPGKVWLPTVDESGNISWTLTDTGGTIPHIRNIKGAKGDKGDKGDAGEKGDKGDIGEQGIQGPKGEMGDTGAAGIGVPAGGSSGQVLVKLSDADYDTAWQTI